MDHKTDGKRNLLVQEMRRYFGETCPALASRCSAASIDLPLLVRRKVAEQLQALVAITNETGRELADARVGASSEQSVDELLCDRALASLEHLNEVAEVLTRWMDELLKKLSAVRLPHAQKGSSPALGVFPTKLKDSGASTKRAPRACL